MEKSETTDELQSLKKIGSTFKKDEFLREVFIKLAADRNTPSDILSAEFTPVEEKETAYLSITAETEAQFSCCLGFDRQEEYWDKERVYENGVARYRDVKKTRKVTDWKPYTGNNSCPITVLVENTTEMQGTYITDKKSSEASLAIQALDKAFQGESCEPDTLEVNRSALENAQALCLYRCYKRAIPSCDHTKDGNYNGKADIKSVSGLILPAFSTTYTYGEKKYTAGSFACGRLSIDYTAPASANNIEKKSSKKALWITLAVAGTLIILTLILSILGMQWIGGLASVLAVGAVVGFFIFRYVSKKRLTKMKRQEKLDCLIKAIKSHNLKELTAEEINWVK